MIIKCLSRKSNVDQLIKYVLAEGKLEPPNKQPKRHLYVPGVKLTKEDIKYLQAEKEDAKLLSEFRAFKGSVKDFIESYISQTTAPGKHNDVQQKVLPIVFKQNLRSRSIKGYIKEFEENEKFRLRTRIDSVKAFHTILSFSHLDSTNLNEKILKDIAQQYISLRGGQSLFVGGVHQDKDHIHIHLIQSGTQYQTGVSNRISRQEFQELKIAMQEYQKQKYPQLVHSMPEHGRKSKEIKKGPEKNIKTHDRTSDKNSLLGLLDATFPKSISTEHFLDQIKDAGHEPYYRGDKLQGIKFEGGQKFRLSNLGFDEKKLKQLDIRNNLQEKALTEIKELRSGRAKEIGKAKISEAAEGRPEQEVLYHGTAKGNYFDTFDLSRENRGVGSNAFHQGKNIYLTDREDAATYFSKQATQAYQLWKCIFDKTNPDIINSEIGEVYKVQLKENANLKVLNYRPDKDEVEKLKAQGYDAVKFKDVAFEAVEGSKEVFDMLKKGVPNTIVVFDSEKVTILENNKPKDFVQEKPLLKQLPFEETVQANIDEKQRARLQELVNRDKAFEVKNEIARENHPLNHGTTQLQELRDIRGRRDTEVGRTYDSVQNARSEVEDKNSDDDRDDIKERDSKPDEDTEDEDSPGPNNDAQDDDNDTNVR